MKRHTGIVIVAAALSFALPLEAFAREGKVRGKFLRLAEKKIGEIGNNAVDPQCELKGIGQQMYRAVFEHFRRHGLLYAKVQTGLDEAHARARRAYDRAGFDIRHEDVTYYRKL